jgi:hypothetical protein
MLAGSLKRRLVRASAVALLVLVIAVTPLSAFLSGGRHETRLPGSTLMSGATPWVNVVLQDETGFVRSIAPASSEGLGSVHNPDGNHMALVATWFGGCGDRTVHLSFARDGDRFRLTERTDRFGCPFMIAVGRSVLIVLWSPITAADVDFDPQLKLGS